MKTAILATAAAMFFAGSALAQTTGTNAPPPTANSPTAMSQPNGAPAATGNMAPSHSGRSSTKDTTGAVQPSGSDSPNNGSGKAGGGSK